MARVVEHTGARQQKQHENDEEMNIVTTSAEYTKKDLMLYALGIGCGLNDDDDELRYLYEHHGSFEAFPLYPLALAFHAVDVHHDEDDDSGGGWGVRAFPPIFMRTNGLGPLPSSFLVEPHVAEYRPVILHVSQSLDVHRPLPVVAPVTVVLTSRVVRVAPKSVGTFVTTRTDYHDSSDRSLFYCTATSTVLLLGLPKERVRSYNNNTNTTINNNTTMNNNKQRLPVSVATTITNTPPHRVETLRTSPEQALLFRLSGDYNPLHVVASPPSSRPILHGLCTLGFAVRAVLRYCRQNSTSTSSGAQVVTLKHVDATFTKPVVVTGRATTLEVSIWDTDDHRPHPAADRTLYFRVRDASANTIVVDRGVAVVTVVGTTQDAPNGVGTTGRSRL